MQDKFKQWLIKTGRKKNTANTYSNAVNKISEHYSENETLVNIYTLTNQNIISKIAHDYCQTGKYSEFGYKSNSLYRAAITRYSEFFVTQHESTVNEEQQNEAFIQEESEEKINFAYERDLQTTLCSQVSELFPNYKIFGENNLGIEYSIKGRRIDVLLEHVENNSLLAVELKSGVADFKVFGQISMYIGLLKEKFPNIDISGVIIAGSIHESLQQACLITDIIELRVYRMSLELEKA